MSDEILLAAIKEPVYVFGDDSPLTPELVTRCVELVRDVARWNRNTTSENHVVCVSDDREVIRRYLSAVQRDKADRDGGDWNAHGTTWGRWGDKPLDCQIIWINPKHNGDENYVNTFAHELAHAFTRTNHGWTWRRMFIMTYPLIAQIVLPDDESILVPQLARRVVGEYRRCTVNGKITTGADPLWQARALEETVAHITAAARCHKKFKSFIV